MNQRRRKKTYKHLYGYNPVEADRMQKMIHNMIKHTECRLVENNCRTYAGFLASIKQRPRSKARWWRRTR